MSTKTKEFLTKDKRGKRNFGFGTLAIHAGEKPDKITGAVAPVIVRSKTYAQKHFGRGSTYEYSRGRNPTRDKLIEKLEDLEGGGTASVFASGLAAETAFFLTLSPGDHILLCHEVYGGTFRLLNNFLSRFGITYDFADFSTESSIIKNIKLNTKYIFVETPTNPSLHIIDLSLVARVSKKTGIPFVVDATFSPPCTTRPFEYGAETVIHSLSKYIAGHNDILGGAVITKNKKLADQISFLHRTLGAVLSPDECYRVLQGIKTLELRWKRVSETSLIVARFLEKQKGVKKVFYPGISSHPHHDIANKQHKNGFGGVISFILKKTDFKSLKKFVDTIREHSPIIYAESLASPETILAYPPLMSHKSLPKKVRESLGITDGFFRLSVGFEDPKDILEGLRRGLNTLSY